jgi:hypothetical protein
MLKGAVSINRAAATAATVAIAIVALRGTCLAQDESQLAKASQNPIANLTSVPMPDGTRRTGIADIQEQLFFTPRKPGFVVWGVGPVASIPTATNDVARTGQWALGPTAVGS